MSKKEKRTIYFDDDVWDALQKKSKMSHNTNISALVNDGLRYAMFPEYRGDREADMVKMMQVVIDSFVQHRKKTARDLAFIQEICLEHLDEFYRYNLPIPEDQVKEREVLARTRKIDFIKKIQNNMPKLKSFSEIEQGD